MYLLFFRRIKTRGTKNSKTPYLNKNRTLTSRLNEACLQTLAAVRITASHLPIALANLKMVSCCDSSSLATVPCSAGPVRVSCGPRRSGERLLLLLCGDLGGRPCDLLAADLLPCAGTAGSSSQVSSSLHCSKSNLSTSCSASFSVISW